VSTTCEHYQISGQKVAFAVIDETEITYRVKAPSSGDGTFTGEWVDLLVLTTELEEGKERWETIADTIVIVGGGGAGTIEEGVTATPTPTPFIPAVTKVTRVVPVMEAGKEVAMVFENMDVFMIAIKADKNVSDAKVVVERVEKSAEIPEPSGTGYIYLDIEVENAGDAKIEGRIEFKVANSWIADNSIDEATVTLSRYDTDEGWKALATSKTSEDADFVYFEAATPGFSTFAITGEKKEKEVEAAAATPTPATTATPSPTTPPSSEEVQGFEAAFAAVSLLIVYTMMFRKKGKGGDVK
jgi:PGF-pre-PGF domain-containing protein